MLREIGSWRGHENSARFVGSRQREEGADKPISVVADTSKQYAVSEDRSRCPLRVSAFRLRGSKVHALRSRPQRKR